MKKTLVIVLVSLLVIVTTQGQLVEKKANPTPSSCDNNGISLLTGYNQGDYGFAEIGVAYNAYTFCEIPMAFSYFASNEIRVSDRKIIGPKIGAWFSVFAFSMGLNFIYYTDFDKKSFVFRPELGLGAGPAKLVYGYNARFNPSLNGINRHQVGIAYCLRLWREKDKSLTK